MKKLKLSFISALLLLVSPLFITGIAVADKPEKITVVYGGSSWLGHYPVWVGIKKGIFKEKQLGVLFQNFYASSGRMGAMVSGDLDFAATGAISAIALMAVKQKSFYVFGTPDSYATVEGIVGKKSIKSAKDLKGKKLAVTFASSAHVLVLDILNQNGLDPNKDVELINLKVSEMPAAYQSGEIDAAALWTPHFNKLLKFADTHEILNDTEFSLYKKYGLGPGPDLITVRKEFAEKYPKTTKAFIEGYFESIEYIINNQNESAQILLELTGLDLDEQNKVMKDITWYPSNKQQELLIKPGEFVTGLQHLAQFLYDNKQIDTVPDVKEWVNASLLE